MIKIIKHGRLRQCTCCHCGCIFTFEKEDVNECGEFVKCPDCKERNTVSL